MFAIRRPQLLSHRGVLALAAALFAAVTAARFAFTDPTNGIGFFYLVPICLVAAERGARAGVGVAAAASAIILGWAAVSEAPVSMIGNIWRLVTFAAIGVLVGGLVRQ